MAAGGGLRVLLAAPLPRMAVAALRAVDAAIDLTELSPAQQEFFASRAPVQIDSPGEQERGILSALLQAEVLITFPQTPDDLSGSVPRLRWLQLLTAGADELPDQELLQRVPVTTIREVRAKPVAEYALLLILAFAKRLRDSSALQRQRLWQRVEAMELQGRTLGIVGLGSIGGELARMATALGMRVIATRRTGGKERPPDVETLLPAERLPELLRESDFVVLAAPSTAATRHLIGEAELHSMKSSAVLINVARGALVDERALVQALRDGQIAGAGLDVFETEPLPASSPLYSLENVFISCHSAGMTDRFTEGVVPILCDNLRRFLAGEPLRNQIDPARGY